MREWILRALIAVKLHGEYSNLYLRKHLKSCDSKDRNLATRIFYGTIQNWSYCEACWQIYAKRKVNDKIAVLLTMSTYQLLFLDKVPAYAIINDAVNLAGLIQPRSKGFVNAILHQVKPLENEKDPIAFETSCPSWVVKMWTKQYGKTQAENMARCSCQILPVTIRCNPLRMDKEEIAQYKTIKSPDIYIGHDITSDPLYISGKISVQDRGSLAIAQFMDVQAGDRVLDCCSAPGTKAMAMAERMKDEGHIDCIDIHAHRVQLIQQDAKRLGLSCIHAQVGDATKLNGLGMYSKVLCDVPCSGYGVLARKPDIKLHMQPSDMDTLIPLQAQILSCASTHVVNGGILVYSTCTLNKKENEKQVDRFLASHPEFILLSQKTIFPNSMHDGFFMAKMQKSKNLV